MKRLGERLIEAGLVSAEAIDQALAHQKITGHRLGDCLVELGLVQENAQLKERLSDIHGDINNSQNDKDLADFHQSLWVMRVEVYWQRSDQMPL